MSSRNFKYFLSLVLLSGFSLKGFSQAGLCPANMDFEEGTLNNWLCRTGSVSIIGGLNTVTWTGTGQVPGRHTIISSLTAGTDPYGFFPEMCPNGSGFSVKLGNNLGGSQAEGISYTYVIPATATVFSIYYHYAVVFQNPPDHQPEEQPRFRARIVNVTDNTTIACVNFDFTASASLPGFRRSTVDPLVLFKDWTPITLNLSGYAGKTILLEFITSDCTRNGHFGYAYMDVNTNCNGAIAGSTICLGDTAVDLTAPAGFQSYQWYADNTFTIPIASTQVLHLTPPPAVGTVFPVIVTPYPGFGCTDTLYGTMTVAPKPVSVAGPDVNLCVDQTGTLGGPPTLGYTYGWTPTNQVNNPILSNPVAWNSPPLSTEFIVKTTDVLTGCFSYDTTYVTTTVVDTAIQINGINEFCNGDLSSATLSINNTSTNIQWYDDNGPIPGANAPIYHPLGGGNYWAALSQDGCPDSTSTLSIFIRPLPVASFFPDKDTQCVTNNAFLLTNMSTVSDNSAMTYNWTFSDGSNDQVKDPTKTFLTTGNYFAKLLTTTAFGCKDSITLPVFVLPNGVPDFSWDSICPNRPVLFKNLSNENGSSQINYSWIFNNGGPGSNIKNPIPVNYSTPGRVDVSLKMTTLGCETDPKTVTKSVLVNNPAAGIRYRDITVPLGSSQLIHVRDTVGDIYRWRPQTDLSHYDLPYTEFFADNNDVKYFIDIIDEHTCVTTDTLQMMVLKKTGYYLPTAFTPNGDGLNDIAKPYLVGMKGLKRFSIYNRWGNLVFSTEKYGEGWDGRFKGTPQATGVYVWVLEYINKDDKTEMAKGTITVIR